MHRPDSLQERLFRDPAVRTDLVVALASLVSEEIASARGLSGATLRSAVATLERMKPGFLPRAIDKLLDEWVETLEPWWVRYRLAARHESFGAWIGGHREDVAEALLAVTNARAERSGHRMARMVLRRVGGSARANLAQAVPRMGALFDGYLQGA